MTASTQTAPLSAPKQRIALWDNARFAFIVLVVIGHLVSTIRTDTDFGFAVYAYIYLFHMPAMILLSGLFAKPETSPKAVRSTVQLIVVWLMWEGIWAVIRAIGGNLPGKGFLINPAWTLWFIVTLVTIRLIFPYIARLRHPLLFSVALALLSSLSPAIGTEFSASRTLVFLPFFVAGWMIRDRGWLDGDWFQKPKGSLLAAGWAVLGAVALVFVVTPNFKGWWRIDRWLTWRDDYATLFARAPIGGWAPGTWGGTALAGIGVAAVLLAVAAAMTFALLVVVPRGQSVITVWGSRTLYVYLLHGLIVGGLRASGVIGTIGEWGSLGVLLLIVASVALTALLSMTWVTKAFRPVIEPKIDWMLRRD